MTEKEDDTSLILQVKKAVHGDLSTRYTNIKDKLTMTSLIDPRFKLVPFLSEAQRLEAYHLLTVEAIAVVESNQDLQSTFTAKKEPDADS